ncbi:endonuclease NucS [Halobaculum sp. MBLA0147]|uniref:endonuclease NucS n=1 Tax=Halobaculum sp. MBLA0147 TaxID=3079934 RepID=UPI003523502E
MTPVTLHEPAHREALWELEAAFDRGDVVTVYGPCTVEYDGRATSSLGEGRRLVVLKPDGTALVHTDEGHEPVNWQPPGSTHHAAVRDGRLRLRSRRENPDERLDVRFAAVDHLVAYPVSGRRQVAVAGTEADLKRRVVDEPSLVEAGFTPTATERETAAGAVDVFGRDADGRPTVVELKRRRVGPDAVGQLRRYVDALRRERRGRRVEVDDSGGSGVDAESVDDSDGDTTDDSDGDPVPPHVDDAPDGPDDDPRVRGVLVAPSVTDRAADLLAEAGFDHVALDPPTPSADDTGSSDGTDSSDDTGPSDGGGDPGDAESGGDGEAQ